MVRSGYAHQASSISERLGNAVRAEHCACIQRSTVLNDTCPHARHAVPGRGRLTPIESGDYGRVKIIAIVADTQAIGRIGVEASIVCIIPMQRCIKANVMEGVKMSVFIFGTVVFIVAALATLLYLLPGLVAVGRRIDGGGLVFLINIFIGWTGLVWLVLLLIAFLAPSKR